MEQDQQKSYRLVWLVAASVAVLAVIIGIVVFIVLGAGTKKESDSVATSAPSASPSIATKAQIEQNLKDIDASIKQAATDQAAAKAALKDGDKQIKVGN